MNPKISAFAFNANAGLCIDGYPSATLMWLAWLIQNWVLRTNCFVIR